MACGSLQKKRHALHGCTVIKGLNMVGLRRSTLGSEKIRDIKDMYNILYKENLTLSESIRKIETTYGDIDHAKLFTEFLKESERGICR